MLITTFSGITAFTTKSLRFSAQVLLELICPTVKSNTFVSMSIFYITEPVLISKLHSSKTSTNPSSFSSFDL